MKYVSHRFFCPRCGREGIPIARKISQQREKGHLKRLYCPYCNMTLNMVECRDDFEVAKFKEDFKNGDLAHIVDEDEGLVDWNENN